MVKKQNLAIPSLSGHAVIFSLMTTHSSTRKESRNPLFIGSCSDMQYDTVELRLYK